MANIGSTPSLIVGIAAGGAASAALQPALERPKQDAWASQPNRIVDVATLARLLAQGGVDLSTAQGFAHRNGYDNSQLAALAYISQTVPGAAEAMHLWRLGFISDDLFRHTLVKAGLDQRYVDPIIQTKTEELLGLGDIAYAVVRGILPSPSYVPVPPPVSGDKVPRFPQVPIDPETLAAKIGYTPEALQVMVGRSGLSMAPVMAAQAFFRGIIGANDYLMAIAEGDLRTEWADAVRAVSRQIPTADQFVEGHLRGWITETEMLAGAARHGMVGADTQLLFETHRRPLPVATITKALARGGTFNPAANEIQDPYSASVHQANLGPEWYGLGEAMKYTYPSAFVVRSLLKDGAISETEGENIFLYEGYPPGLAHTIASHYAAGGKTAADPHVTKAQTTAWTKAQASYIAEESTAADVQPIFQILGVPAAAQTQITQTWDAIRALVRKQLSPAQIKKAYGEGAINPATGVAWTHAEAMAALEARGYSTADATVLLEL